MMKKKGVSAIVGYVLLISFGIVMSLIVYTYLKTYAPKDSVNCPEGVSIFLKEYTCEDNLLNITVENNGRFNFSGYFIKAANSTTQEVATIDISKNFTGNPNLIYGSSILFSLQNTNLMGPDIEMNGSFNLSQDIAMIELIPMRFQGEGKNAKFVICGSAKVQEEISCS
jgi:hypothetical protein